MNLSKFELAYKYRKKKDGLSEKTDAINEAVTPQVVFMEKCFNIVKPGGAIDIVVSESMISNKKYSYVAKYILRMCYIILRLFALVRRLIEKITVCDEMLIVEFKSGLEVEVDV